MEEEAQPQPGRKRGKTAARLGLSLAVLILALAVAEIGARIHLGPNFAQGVFFGPATMVTGRYDEDLGWVSRANVDVTVAGPGFRHRVRTNSRGLRDREYEYEPAQGVLRVVLLGDSTAWGWGVEDGEAFASVLDQRLGPSIEIVNLAVPGYSTDQELLLLEAQGRSYRPDLILVTVVLNDLLGNASARSHAMQKPHFVREQGGSWSLANHPVPPPAPGDKIANRRRRRMLATHVALVSLMQPTRRRRPPNPPTDPEALRLLRQTWDGLVDPTQPTHMLLARIQRLADEVGADMLAFVLPHMHDTYLYDSTRTPPEDALGPDFRTYGTRRLEEAGEAIGFSTLSLDGALLAAVRGGLDLDCGDHHLNAEGNRVVADRLEPVLTGWAARRRGE